MCVCVCVCVRVRTCRRRHGAQEELLEEDLTKDMEDPTPVPNMEEVILPKNGERAHTQHWFLLLFQTLQSPIYSSALPNITFNMMCNITFNMMCNITFLFYCLGFFSILFSIFLIDFTF